MKSSNISKLLPVQTNVRCVDNTGAKVLQIIGYTNLQGHKRRRLTGGVGSVAIVVVKKGLGKLKGKVYRAVIVRQKAPYTRKDIGKIRFTDNAAILLGVLDAKKMQIKGVVAKEAVALNSVLAGMSLTTV